MSYEICEECGEPQNFEVEGKVCRHTVCAKALEAKFEQLEKALAGVAVLASPEKRLAAYDKIAAPLSPSLPASEEIRPEDAKKIMGSK